VPIFAFLGAWAIGSWIADRFRREGSNGRAWLGPAVAIVLLGASVFLALDTWTETTPTMERLKVADAAAADRALDAAGVPTFRPVVLIVDETGPNPDLSIPLMAHTLRTQLDPRRIPTTYVYVGDPDAFLEGRVDVLGEPDSERRDGVAWRFMRDLRPVLDDDPVAVIARAYHPGFDAWAATNTDLLVSPSVGIVSGVAPAHPSAEVTAPGRLTPASIALAAVIAGVVLFLVGAAWTFGAGTRSGWFGALSIAPGVGIAAIVLVGLLGDLLLGQPNGGRATAAVAFVAGVAVSLVMRTRRRRVAAA
jgi:hypothetical protein